MLQSLEVTAMYRNLREPKSLRITAPDRLQRLATAPMTASDGPLQR